MKKLLPLLIPVLALVGGVAAGEMLRPAQEAGHAATEATSGNHGAAEDGAAPDGHPKTASDHPAPPPADDHAAAGDHGGGQGAHGETAAPAEGWFTFPSQFFVPLMRNGDMGAVMILTLTIETGGADLPAMKQQEHRLRDALLRELLIHANTGGFDGNFTSEARLAPLRERLQKAAQASTDLSVKAVLIEDIARQAG
jgi:flagellar FliL protein